MRSFLMMAWLPSLACAALPYTTTWDVQASSCNAAWGGGFDTSKTGTDYSTSTSPRVTFDGSGVTATTTAASATITISGYTVAAEDVGNIVNVTGGTGFTAGRYSVKSVTTGTNQWTLDRNVSTAAASGMTGYMGGCVDLATALANMTGDNGVFVKYGQYNLTATIATPTVTSSYMSNRIVGYYATHGDEPSGNQRPTIATNGNAITAMSVTGNVGWRISNLIIDGSAGSGSLGTIGINIAGNYTTVSNVAVLNFSGDGITASAHFLAHTVEVAHVNQSTGNGAIYSALSSTGLGGVYASWIHDNGKAGIGHALGGSIQVVRNVISNNAGAGVLVRYGGVLLNNVIYGNAGDGITATLTVTGMGVSLIENNIIANNTGYAINLSSGVPTKNSPLWDYNATWNNRGNTVQAEQYNNLNPGTHDVNLTATPFVGAVSSGAGDWSLNSNTPGGAQLRSVGYSLLLPALTTSNHIDIGAYQHADPSGVTSGGGWIWVQ